jgi:hypothetical protein
LIGEQNFCTGLEQALERLNTTQSKPVAVA